MALLTTESLNLYIKENPLKMEKVEIPEMGAHVFVRQLTAAEGDAFETRVVLDQKLNPEETDHEVRMKNFRARYLTATLCDENRNPIFKYEDAAIVGALSSAVITPLFKVAKALNRIDPEELEKNSEKIQ